MARSLKIRHASSPYIIGRHDGIRIRIEVVCTSGVCPGVFVYRMMPVDPHGNNQGHFDHIASPVDLAEMPKDAPCPGDSPEWFRLSYVDILLRSVHEAENFLECVIGDLRRLMDTLCTMDNFTASEDTLIVCNGGTDCDPEPPPIEPPMSSMSAEMVELGPLTCITAEPTNELLSGIGVPWGTSTLDDDILSDSSVSSVSNVSFSSDDPETRRVELAAGQTSQLLLTNGFDFSALPDDAVVESIKSRISLRDTATSDPVNDATVGIAGHPTIPPMTIGSTFQVPVVPLVDPGEPHARLVFLSLQHPHFMLGSNLATSEVLTEDWQELTHDNHLFSNTGITVRDLKNGAFGLGIVVGNDFYNTDAQVELGAVTLEICYRVHG